MNLLIEWPQIVFIAIMIIEVIAHGCMHGKPRIGKFNVGVKITDYVIVLLLLYWGGFFTAP